MGRVAPRITTVDPSETIPTYSMYVHVMQRTVCPHCHQFHSSTKIRNTSGTVSICMTADYNKHSEPYELAIKERNDEV